MKLIKKLQTGKLLKESELRNIQQNCNITYSFSKCALLSVWQYLWLCIYRQGDQSEAGDANPSDNQSHTGDQCQKQEEPPPPAIPVDNKEEQDQEKSPLSSSVVIDVPNVQSSLELSTITGIGKIVCLCFSGADTYCIW